MFVCVYAYIYIYMCVYVYLEFNSVSCFIYFSLFYSLFLIYIRTYIKVKFLANICRVNGWLVLWHANSCWVI